MSIRLLADQPDRLRLEGELDFASAVTLRPELERQVSAAGPSVLLDMSGVTRVNSVGLSLILVAARIVEAQGGSLSVSGVPEGLQSMAVVCGLDQWLDSIAVSTSAG
ncbi:STAS domain-containing protein [Halopseudomonas nanhaiensis]|uniref:STAS domain-containing protein n=1 Tax=Halopseudomonas nanhaiensis TaxID=2830842 RepID=UPI001CBE60A8|nr:STAS domain-containing protein [Halopseudomonas nanhaiensis]UAW97823.1 STAS domain-containing protein [Halopseudomonas nanhaiensis]